MRETIIKTIEEHALVVGALLQKNVGELEQLCKIVRSSLLKNGKLLIAGNGGSAADSQHLAAELIGRFQCERLPLPAIALTTDSSILSSIGNDYGFDYIFSRQVQALCFPDDVLIAISTSGNSQNLVLAVEEAKKKRAFTVGLLGKGGGKLAPIVDLPIIIDSNTTARVQECHILIAHILCQACDEKLDR